MVRQPPRVLVVGAGGCGEDAAAWVLGGLEPGEAAEFARHVESCAECRQEVAALRSMLTVLPNSARADPVPRPLRRRVLAAARAEPKARASRVRWRPAPMRSLAPGAGRRPTPMRSLAPGAGRRPTPMRSLAPALTIAVGLFVVLGLPGSSERVIASTVGHAQLRFAGGQAELVIDRLEPLPGDHIYELWLQRGLRPAPSALFGVTSDGTALVGVPGDLRGVTRLMVTVEPAGGSLVPTGRLVVVAPVT